MPGRPHRWLTMLAMLVAMVSAGSATAAPDEVPFAYDDYAWILAAFVDDTGLVDYPLLKRNREKLDTFVSAMGALSRETYDDWSEAERIAFLCNAYNAVTLQKIIDHYPIQRGGLIASLRFPKNSIRQIKGIWDTFTTPILGEPMTLDHIEHEILRKDFDEPRIHMAIVCAAHGCPPLRNEPFTGDRLDEQLEDQSRTFLHHPEKFRLDMTSGTVYLSGIFKWFGADFINRYTPDTGFTHLGETERSVLAFVSRYLEDDEARYLREEQYRVAYLEYDWSLNEQ